MSTSLLFNHVSGPLLAIRHACGIGIGEHCFSENEIHGSASLPDTFGVVRFVVNTSLVCMWSWRV